MIKINDIEYITELEYQALPDKEKHNWSIQSLWAYKLKAPDNKYKLYISYDEYDTLTDNEKALYDDFICDYYSLIDMDNIGKYKPEITKQEYNTLSDDEKELYSSGEYYYYDPETQTDTIPIKDIYYTNKPKGILSTDTLEIHFALKKDDYEDSKNRPYISAFYRLQEILNKIVLEYDKEYLYYKQITKITDKIKKVFKLQDPYKSLETIEFIKAFDTLNIVIFYNVYSYTGRQTKTEYKRYYDIGFSIIFDNDNLIEINDNIDIDDLETEIKPIDIFYNNEYFTSKKEFDNFKNKIKSIYKECDLLLRALIVENETKNKPKITDLLMPIGNNNSVQLYKGINNDKNIDYPETRHITDNLRLVINKNDYTPFKDKTFDYITSCITNDLLNSPEPTSIINLEPLFVYTKSTNKKEFYRKAKNFIYNINETLHLEYKNKDNDTFIKMYVVAKVGYTNKREPNIIIQWNKDFIIYHKYKNHNSLTKKHLNTTVLSIPDRQTVAYKVAKCLNYFYYYSKNNKYINIKPDGYAYIPIETLLNESNLLNTKTTIKVNETKATEKKRAGDSISILIDKLNYLNDTDKIDYDIVLDNKGSDLNKNFIELKPKEKIKTYIKFKMLNSNF